ncbi:FAD/NAD(P)-binding protein [Oleiagrimonas sp. C23AA]|uniref:FAD/NAD(P)-binding protein n=1 Tax=Oleiagrimonas sp. C23AA TaxID=2719047 RepID=UPI0014229665|nr:FAD/NAD(P)-binding protein [Oleiagrimonas sp. C23AA]NII09488.1 FAD-dependent oxidoreductase [Oleiagrimonas sp. C23AA]
MYNIAIIGGGAAGSAVFGELLQATAVGTVHWVTGGQATGRGIAYATDNEQHLLNVRASGMGLFAEHEEQFLQHAMRHRAGVSGADFLPRGLFGDFIEAQIQGRMEEARIRGRHFQVHEPSAERIQALPDGSLVVQLASGHRIQAHSVVLALGALSPRPLRAVTQRALASGRYVVDPWRPPELENAPRRYVVIGTGLTAVDTLLSAASRWPHAELVAVSRHGQLPFRHPVEPLAPCPHQARLNARLLACHGPLAMLRQFRRAMHEAPTSDWRSLLDGMRPINARLWQSMTLEQRRQFLHRLRWLWEAGRHRMAPGSADAIQRLIDNKRLQVHAARVLKVDGEDNLQVHVRHRATQVHSTLPADVVVQATGLDTTVGYTRHPLLSQLIEDGLVRADPLQLGLAALPNGALINAQGRAMGRLYAIGSLLRGSQWECTAMPEIRVAAKALAGALQSGQSQDTVNPPHLAGDASPA